MKKKAFVLFGVLLITVLFAVCIGRYPISFHEILDAFVYHKEGVKSTIITSIRLPRILCVMLCGGALSLAGAIYQHLFRNPLVSGDLLGVSSGACVGAIIGMLCGVSSWFVSLLAFGCGLITMMLAFILAKNVQGSKTLNLIIAGIVISAMEDALIMLCKMGADPSNQLPTIELFLMGGFSTITWEHVYYSAVFILPISIGLYFFRWQIEVLSYGKEEAMALGVPVLFIERLAIASATLLIAAVVSIAGIVSWISLIIPHIVRLFYGRGLKDRYFHYILMGGIVSILCDTIARTLFTIEIPISIVTSILGGIVLIILFRRKQVRL